MLKVLSCAVVALLFSACGTTPEGVAEYQARKPDRNSVLGWKPAIYGQTWRPGDLGEPPQAPKPDAQERRDAEGGPL